MRLLKLAALSLMLAAVLILPGTNTEAENTGWCYDCWNEINTGRGPCRLLYFDWEEYRCVYETECAGNGDIPYIVTFCE